MLRMLRWEMNVGRFVIVALSVALLAGVLWVIGPVNVLHDMMLFPIWAITSVLVLLLVNLVIVSSRLARILHHFGFDLPPGIASRASVSGHLAGLFIVSIFGQVVGRHLVLRRHGVSSVLIAALTAYERVVLVIVGGILCFGGALYLVNTTEIIKVFADIPIVEIFLTGGGGLAFSVWIGRSRFERWLIAQVGVKGNIVSFAEIILVTVFAQLVTLTLFVVAVIALFPDANVSHVIAAAAITSFAASLPLTVNGWGIRELAAVYTLGLLGIPSSSALAVSILVGLCSTLVILIAAPVTLGKSVGVVSSERNVKSTPLSSLERQNSYQIEKIAVWTIALFAAVLIFFQVHVALPSGVINFNLADPFALLAFAAAVTHCIYAARAPDWRIPGFNVALITISLLIVFAFVRGALEVGVTQWALASRLMGWVVLLGYISIGYLLIRYAGYRGLRRFIETIFATGFVIVIFQICLRWAHVMGWEGTFPVTSNFQGYSGNRNAFAFQLLLCSAAILAYSGFYERSGRRGLVRAGKVQNDSRSSLFRFPKGWTPRWALLVFIQGVLLLGIYYTGSHGGLITGAILLVAAWAWNLADRRFVVGSIIIGAVCWFFPKAVFWLYKQTISLFHVLDSSLVSRGAKMTGTSRSDISGQTERLDSIIKGLDMWWDNPVFGVGLGVFFQNSTMWFDRPVLIHSTPIWILSEFGLFGFIIFLWAFYLVVRFLRIDGFGSSTNRLITFVLLVFSIFCLVHEIFYQRLFWLILGGASAAVMYQDVFRSASRRAVCHIINGLDAGGAERMLTRLVVAPNQERIQHRVISLMDEGVFGRELRTQGISLSTLGMKRGQTSLLALWRLVKILKTEKPDIIMSWLYYADLLGFIAGKLAGVKRTYWNLRCSDMTQENRSPLYKTLMWFLARLSPFPSGVVANSKAGIVHHQHQGYAPKTWTLIPNGVNLEQFRPDPTAGRALREELGVPGTTILIVHVGRFHPMKDYGMLLVAASEVISRHENAHFVLVGKDVVPENPFFATKIDDSILAGRVHLLGPRQDIPELLAAVDLLVLTSAYGEGLPNVVIEAMASEVPCVVTDVGDAARVVGDTGWVVQTRDALAMVEAVVTFLDASDIERRAMGAKARQRILQEYAIETAIKRYQDLFLDNSGR